MARTIDRCILQGRIDGDWTVVASLVDAEWTGFAPAGCGVDQGRVIALPEQTDHPALLDPDGPDRDYRLLDCDGEVIFEFLGYVDDRRPRGKGKIVLGISTTPVLSGRWREIGAPA